MKYDIWQQKDKSDSKINMIYNLVHIKKICIFNICEKYIKGDTKTQQYHTSIKGDIKTQQILFKAT